MRRPLASLLALPILVGATIPSTPDLGKAEGRCRPNESGPSFIVTVEGLKDRAGNLKLEVYPANNTDFLQDDNILISQGKTFSRVEVDTPSSGTPKLCIRVPSAGTYSVMLLHDRDRNHKFGWRVDGLGFAGNPKLGWSKPKAAAASARAGVGPTPIDIVLNYQRGLSMRPLDRGN